MEKTTSINFWYKIGAFLIIVVSLLVRLRNISSPLLDAHYFRQTQTATVARNFYYYGIDIFHPKLDILGVGKEQVLLLEFPFYQAMVASVSYLAGYSDKIGKIISIFFGLAGGLALLSIVNSISKNRIIGLIALVFYLFAPLNIFFQQAFMIESTVVALHISSLYLWLKYVKKKNWYWYLAAIVCTSLAFTQKNVYAPFLILPVLSIFYNNSGKKRLFSKDCIMGIIIPVIIFMLWQRYVDATNTANGNGFFTSGNTGQQLWNFGTIADRLSIKGWKLRMLAIFASLTKPFVFMFVVGLLALVLKKIKSPFFWFLWLLSMTIYYFVFFRIQSHEYYFMIVIPIASIIAANGLFTFAQYCSLVARNKKNFRVLILYSLVIFYMLFFAVKSWQNSIPTFALDNYTRDNIDLINSVLKEEGYVVFVQPAYGWNSVFAYYTKRKGLTLNLEDLSKEKIEKLRRVGYKYVVFIGVASKEIKEADLSELLLDKKDLKIYQL